MAEPFLVAADLAVRFGGLLAVDGVSLSVDRGEVVGLIGPNGAGKTTTFGALWGLTPLARGTVRLGGADATGWSPARRARHGLARTFQRLELFGSMTVRENLLYATEARALGERPWRLLGSTRHQDPGLVDELVDLLGLAPVAERTASDLPVGAGRLIEFGRALAARPELLLLDEPSSGLDSAETSAFVAQIRRAVDHLGCGVLLIEHDMSLVTGVCERLHVLDFGRPITEGPTGQVVADPRVRAAYLGNEIVEVPHAG
ncbi:MAG: branched-chain amino acid transport system ATP-binding protein livF [Acidimicrobiaceae bacterium]